MSRPRRDVGGPAQAVPCGSAGLDWTVRMFSLTWTLFLFSVFSFEASLEFGRAPAWRQLTRVEVTVRDGARAMHPASFVRRHLGGN